MPRDYKNVPRSGGKKTNRRTTVKNSNSRRKKSSKKKPTPGWVWMLGGLMIGLCIAALVYFLDRSDQNVTTISKAITQAIPEPAPAKKSGSDDENDGPRFDFYTLLPEYEVIIPESETREEQARIKEKDDVAYMIQVGSFRAYGEADSLKAQIALLGIEADIDPVSSKGERWLRVRVGPFTSTREMNKTRNRLHSNNINTMLVKIKK